MNIELFSLSDEPFENEETVISVFKRNDGEIFVECADVLSNFPKALEENFADVLSAEAMLFSYNFAISELNFYAPLVPSENCAKLIWDTYYRDELNTIDIGLAVRLNGKEDYPPELEDIKLGAENGYTCFGTVVDGKVVSAAYAFLPDEEIDGEVEIGVETVEGHKKQGYGAQNVSALAYELHKRGIDVIYSYYAENTPSASLAFKCGFTPFAEGFEITLERSDNNAI